MTETLKVFQELDICNEEVSMYKGKLKKETEKVEYWMDQWSLSQQQVKLNDIQIDKLTKEKLKLKNILNSVGIGSAIALALTAIGGLFLW